MERLEYNINFYRSDLTIDIAERLNRSFPKISLEDCLELAKNSIDKMLNSGNYAVYQGLVEYCFRIAEKQHQNLKIINK